MNFINRGRERNLKNHGFQQILGILNIYIGVIIQEAKMVRSREIKIEPFEENFPRRGEIIWKYCPQGLILSLLM